MDTSNMGGVQVQDADMLRVVAAQIAAQMASMRIVWGEGKVPPSPEDDIFTEMATETVSVSNVDDSYEAIYSAVKGE